MGAPLTVWKGVGKERLDVENPNPGKRDGQLHYQDNDGNKYLYDFDSKTLRGPSKTLMKKLESTPAWACWVRPENEDEQAHG